LADSSLLVQTEGPDGDLRFIMLETIREFAWEQLVAAGEVAAMRERHARHFLAVVESTGGLLFAGPQKRAMSAARQANIQAALRWLVEHG
jgi:hypothetical protein